jgi:hypothetical protein
MHAYSSVSSTYPLFMDTCITFPINFVKMF